MQGIGITGSIASTTESADGRAINLQRRSSHSEVVRDDEDDPLPAKNEEGPQVRMRDVFGPWLHLKSEHAG